MKYYIKIVLKWAFLVLVCCLIYHGFSHWAVGKDHIETLDIGWWGGITFCCVWDILNSMIQVKDE